MNRLFEIAKESVVEFFDDDCPSQAASLSYYTVFSLPPLLLIVVKITSSIFGSASVQARVEDQIRGMIGPEAAQQVSNIMRNVSAPNASGASEVLGIAALLFGATTAFAQLQSALNQAWNVKPNPNRSEVRRFVVKRLVSFGMILGVAFLILVSLLLSALLAAFTDVVQQYAPSSLSGGALWVTNIAVSLMVFTGLFTAINRILPDAQILWRDAFAGGLLTALLFTGGKSAIGLYLGNSDVTHVYGAAGSLAVLLLWTYYSSMILLLGAEFTQVWSRRHGRRPQPEEGAVRIRTQEVPAEQA